MSDQVRRALKDLMGASPTAWVDVDVIKDHIAALEKERDAALADNAALAGAGDRLRDLATHDEACTSLRMAIGHGACDCALGAWDAAMRLTAMTQQTVELLNTRIDDDEKDHARALVRARNEGLEKAARACEMACPDDGLPCGCDEHTHGDRIRALKEPES